ncbi:hypothetical protein [Mucilaginibacter aquaedulcis]|uniref:hypothetical protein n=1 Tax=Mucilaginibacter aquaedulcis TaxID=1187081 RepID=UPI0025B51B88|nr:hypothetical protein [Mucilaginibacter aquaedulcis]MDN3550676.1 hypothetical protein [Mucilaginibacter aquaedulcis]
MKLLELPPYPQNNRATKTAQFKAKENKPVALTIVKDAKIAVAKTKHRWFAQDTPENLTVKGSVIRGALVFTMPVLSAIDWNLGTHTMYFIAPVIFYLEVTAFTMYCPVKALFSNYTHPSRYE